MKRRSAFGLIAALALSLSALPIASAYAQPAGSKTLKVGVRGGVDEEIWEVVTREAAKNGLKVETVIITGTASPNEALNNGIWTPTRSSTFRSCVTRSSSAATRSPMSATR